MKESKRKMPLVYPLTLLVGVFLFFFCPISISAEQKVQKMDISVQLDQFGDAHITENWRVKVDEGSEIYKTIKLTHHQMLTDYSVSMDGEKFSEADFWDVDESKKEKSYRYGQNDNELNWGISRYGTHNYQICYKITNFVEQTSSDQMILWQFLAPDMSISPKNIRVKIEDPQRKFSAKKGYGIWGFGFAGGTEFKDGAVLIQNSQQLTKDNYVKVMMQIPKHTYSTGNWSDRSFDSYVKEAFKGSDYDYKDYKSGKNIKNDASQRFSLILKILVPLLLIGLGILFILSLKNYHKYYPKLKQIEQRTQGEYCREIPENNIFAFYVFLYSLMGDKKTERNFFTAALLLLVKEEYLTLRPAKKKSKHSQASSDFVLTDKVPDDRLLYPAQRMYKVLAAAATEGLITQAALTEYFEKHNQSYHILAAEFRQYSYDYLISHGFLILSKQTEKTGNRSRDRANHMAKWTQGYTITDRGIEARDDLIRLKNYLLEFSLLDERSAKEVALWDEWMIAAAAFGILTKVENELKKAYPEYQRQSNYYRFVDQPFYLTNFFSYQVGNAVTRSSSSGSGGSSSLGGGGNSGGSSGGGGFR